MEIEAAECAAVAHALLGFAHVKPRQAVQQRALHRMTCVERAARMLADDRRSRFAASFTTEYVVSRFAAASSLLALRLGNMFIFGHANYHRLR